MKLTKLNNNKIFQIVIGLLTALLLILVVFILYHKNRNSVKITMGGQFYSQFSDSEGKDIEKYFRPSKLPSINDRFLDYKFFDAFYDKKPSEITLPSNLFKTPENTIGTDDYISNFAYYYAFIEISKEGMLYKISDVQLFGEDFLCAPYHGWNHNAEAVVDIKYGNWCSLVKERYPTKQEGYVKNIYFKGTDGNDYKFMFFQLSNDTDIEIAQYKKDEKGNWNLIKINPEKCLEKKS